MRRGEDSKRIKGGHSENEGAGKEDGSYGLEDPRGSFAPYRKLVRAASDCEDSRVLCEARDIGRSHRVRMTFLRILSFPWLSDRRPSPQPRGMSGP